MKQASDWLIHSSDFVCLFLLWHAVITRYAQTHPLFF